MEEESPLFNSVTPALIVRFILVPVSPSGTGKRGDSSSIGVMSGILSKGLLMGARGNSGVILSQLFSMSGRFLRHGKNCTLHRLNHRLVGRIHPALQCRCEDSSSIGVMSGILSKGLLMGARGNSGVILSQLFRITIWHREYI
jgi:dihydroxyacetone kinase-like predicted kinase